MGYNGGMAKKEAPRVDVFIANYVKHKNATQAAIEAGYSEKTAYSQGGRLLKNVEVRQKIDAAMAEKQQSTKWDAERVIFEYEDIINLAKRDGQYTAAVSAISKIVDLNGIEPPKKLDINQHVTIESVKQQMDALKNEYFSS